MDGDNMLSRTLKFVLHFLIVTVIILLTPTAAYAKVVTVEAEGTYLVGDGLNENINIAKELARRDALRNASERAGVYVQSYSVTSNNVLTKDEVTVVSASILQIINQECFPTVEGDNIKFIYRIKANIDVSNLNSQIDRVLNNKEVLRKNVVLEQRISSLEKENITLKNSYNNATNESQKKLYQKLILENENNMANTFRYTERLPKCEMAIGGITFGWTLNYVKQIYGQPDKITHFAGDGVKVINYYYGNNLRVVGRVFARWSKDTGYYSPIAEGDYPVTGVIITDGSLSMPCGIKVGDSYLKVVEKFGIGAKYVPYKHEDRTGYSYLLRATLEEMHFQVDKNGVICEIGTSTDF